MGLILVYSCRTRGKLFPVLFTEDTIVTSVRKIGNNFPRVYSTRNFQLIYATIKRQIVRLHAQSKQVSEEASAARTIHFCYLK